VDSSAGPSAVGARLTPPGTKGTIALGAA
jgi:hypothetical protein